MSDGNPAKLTRIRRFLREARDVDQKWIIRNGTVTGNPSMLIGFPKNLSGMLDCRLAIEKTNHEWPFLISFPETSLAMTDRKSTRLNSSHGYISYAVFCLKKKNT